MATKLKSVQTKSVVNVSQDYSTPPAREIPDSQPAGGYTQPAAAALVQATETQVVIKDSYDRNEPFDEDYDTTPKKSKSLPATEALTGQRGANISEALPTTVPPESVTVHQLSSFEGRSSSDKSNASTVQSKESATSETEIMAPATKTASKLPQASPKSRSALALLRERRGVMQTQQGVNTGTQAENSTALAESIATGKLKSVKTADIGGNSQAADNGGTTTGSITATGKQKISKATSTATQACTGCKRKAAETKAEDAETTKRSKPSAKATARPAANPKQARDESIERDMSYNEDTDSEDESPKTAPGKRGRGRATNKKAVKNAQPTSSYAPTKAAGKLSRDSKTAIKPPAANIETRRQSTRLLQPDESSELKRADISEHDDGDELAQIPDTRIADAKLPSPRREEENVTGKEEHQGPTDSQPVTKRHRAVTKTSRPGDTQDDAVVLSDRYESSPMPEDAVSEDPDPKPAEPVRPTAALPKTPAAARSSPPVIKDFVEGHDDHAFDTITALSSKKANIVGWNKNGPRNQGVLASRTPARYGRSSVKRRRGISSAATSQRTDRSVRRAKSSNVGESVSQAMGELWLKAPAKDVLLQQDDFANIDDFDDQAEDPPLKFKPATAAVKPAVEQRPTSAVLPPPSTNTVKTLVAKKPSPIPDADLLQNIATKASDTVRVMEDQELEGDTLVKSPPPVPKKSKKTAQPQPKLESNMPPPARNAKPTRRNRENIHAEIAPEELAGGNEADAIVEKAAPSRRGRNTDHAASVPPVVVNERQATPTVEEAAKPRSKRSAAPVEPTIERPAKQVRLTGPAKSTTVPDATAVPAPLPARKKLPAVRKLASKPSRHVSQGSQTVDRAGSPIPQGMSMPDMKKTALETFSQEASWRPHRTPEADDAYTDSMVTAYVAPPSHQPEKQHIMSSNAKPMPASPRAESTTIIYRKVSASKSKKLLEKTNHVEYAEDPFASLDDVDALHRKYLKEPQPTAHLSRGAARNDAVAVIRDTAVATSSVASSSDDFLGQVADEEEGTTLFEHEQSMPNKRELLGLDAETPIASDDIKAVSNDDLPSWTASLKPHQLSLFDQMVVCVQQLTKHMFEQENGTEEMLDEYYRRNLYLIQQEEKQQVKNFRQMEKTLRVKKKEKLCEAKRYHHDLVRQAGEFEREAEKQRKRMAIWDAENEELEAFINEHS